MPAHTTTAAAPRSRRREIGFRLAAIALGLAVCALAEGVLGLFDFAQPDEHADPLLGFRAVRPLFTLDAATGTYKTDASRLTFFRPQSFTVQKEPDEFRIFVLGGSTVQGRPFAVKTAFSTWLALALAEADPSRRFRAVNCGGISYASYRLVPVLDEVLHYEPDLIVLYTGQNEFLEDRTYGHLKRRPAWLVQVHAAAARLHTYAALRSLYLSVRPATAQGVESAAPALSAEVEARLDYAGGLEKYHRDEVWQDGVVRHYEDSVRRMLEGAAAADVPLILVNPVSNLRDCPPFKSEHDEALTPAELGQVRDLCANAAMSFKADPARALALWREAASLDCKHAGIQYSLAQCYESLRQPQRAREAYLAAKDLDVCPLRMLESMHDILLRLAEETGTPMVDVRAHIEQHSRTTTADNQWLIDHVHPTIRGHEWIALALARQIADLGVVALPEGWAERAEQRFRVHHDSIESIYFLRGIEQRDVLRRWAQGRVITPVPDAPPAASPDPH